MEEKYPSLLYKYYEIKKFLPKLLSGETLKFSCPFDFNDPFESRSCYQLDSSDEGRRFIREMVNRRYTNPSLKISEARRIEKRFRTPLALEDNELANEVIRRVGVCCFSEAKDSILMWSHYGNEHKGICIGFDTSKSLFQLAWKVKYREEFPIVRRPTDGEDVLLEKTLLTKAACWSYEKEWRIVKRILTEEEKARRMQRRNLSIENFSEEDTQLLFDESGPGYYSFSKEAIAELYLGARVEKWAREKVIQWVKDAGLNIPIYEVKRNPKKYCLGFELAKNI